MVKTIFRLISLSLVGVVAWLLYLWFTQPALIAPLPYKIKVDYGTEVDMAEAAHVLIVGDQLGHSLDRHLKALTQRLSTKLKDPLRIVNWARANEGLNRTLHKLKSLSKLPPIIIYLGSSEEFYEERFHVKERKKILSNIKKFRSENIASLLYTFPQASRFIYAPIHFFNLNEKIVKDPGDFESQLRQEKMEIIFNLFDVELEEMIALTKEKGSYLVLSTAPINLEVPPRSSCSNSTTESLERYQKQLQKDLDEGKHKISLNKIRKLTETSIANAKSFHLLGLAAMGSGFFDEARIAFTKAAAFDCGNWRAHPVFNSIINKKVNTLGIKLIDFNNIVNRHLGSNELFLGDHFPQEIYYNHYIDEVYDTIKLKLNL